MQSYYNALIFTNLYLALDKLANKKAAGKPAA